MKQKWINAYIDVAERFAQLSSAHRLKVGAVVVRDNRVISIGYNGTPAGWDNNCEDVMWTFDQRDVDSQPNQWTFCETKRAWYTTKTKQHVIHAERNALDKLARYGGGGNGAVMFITHMPCLECSKSIYGAGINSVFYRYSYKTDDGVKFLQDCGVTVTQVE